MKCSWMLILMLVPTIALADVFMHQEADGTVVYTDTPSSTSTKIQVITTPQTTPPPAEKTVEPVPEQVPAPSTERKPYTKFLIESPKDQETIQNQPNVGLVLNIEPLLQKGDKIQVFIDEVPLGFVAETSSIALGRLERGTHRVRAALLDADGKILKLTQTITIFVHQAHTGPIGS